MQPHLRLVVDNSETPEDLFQRLEESHRAALIERAEIRQGHRATFQGFVYGFVIGLILLGVLL